MSDLALGLKFISANAERLGAKPGQITLNGQSAGSSAVMALLLHDESASLISGALAQSGPSAVNFINGDMNEEVSRKICARINDLGTFPKNILSIFRHFQKMKSVTLKGQICDSTAEMPAVVAALKESQPSILLACSLGEGFFENTWIPVAYDGVFYTENALEKYLENRVNTGFEVSFFTDNSAIIDPDIYN